MALKTLVAITTLSRAGAEFLERAPSDLFAHAQRIHVGGIEEIDAQLDRAAEERRASSSSSTHSRHFFEP